MSSGYRTSAKPPRKEVIVATFDTPHEAELALAYLESEDIEGRLQDETLIGMAQLYTTALGGVKLWVDIEDAPDAQRLLDGYRVKPKKRKRKRERADEVAKRAFRAAIIGLFLCPGALHVYAIWVLWTQLSGKKLTTIGKRYVFATHVISWGVLGAGAWALFS